MAERALSTRIMEYIEALTLSGGDRDGELFRLMAWQRRFIRGAFASGRGGDAALSLGRGGGKSALCAALACCVADPAGPLHRRRGEVVCVAAALTQSRIVFEDARDFLARRYGSEHLDRADWRLNDTVNVAHLEHKATGSRVRCIGSDPKTMHGLRPALVLADEPAQWDPAKADRAVAALRTSLGKQPGSRLIALGTQPAAKGHWFSKMLTTAAYAQVHAADPDANPFLLATWRRSNPSLDHLPSLREVIESEAVKARMDPGELATFRSLRLNQGTHDTLIASLLSADVWLEIEGEVEREGRCVWGVDLGTSAAQSAVASLWPASGRLEVLAAFPSLPSLEERGLADGVGRLFTDCAERGELLQLGGHAVNVGALIGEAVARFGEPTAIACDRWRIPELRDACKAAGLSAPIVERGMGFKDGGEDVRQFRRAALEQRVRPVPSLLLTSAMSEARTISDAAGNSKLAKGHEGGRRPSARDDAAAAAILAVGLSERMPKRKRRRYLGAA